MPDDLVVMSGPASEVAMPQIINFPQHEPTKGYIQEGLSQTVTYGEEPLRWSYLEVENLMRKENIIWVSVRISDPQVCYELTQTAHEDMQEYLDLTSLELNPTSKKYECIYMLTLQSLATSWKKPSSSPSANFIPNSPRPKGHDLVEWAVEQLTSPKRPGESEERYQQCMATAQ